MEYAAPFAAVCALFRCSQVFVGLVKMLHSRRERVRWNASMCIAFPEPFLLAVVAALALLGRFRSPLPTPLAEAFAMLGAALAAAAAALFVWSLLSYRGVGTGLYLDEDHRLCTRGAYGVVRHPLYLAALLAWFGLAAAVASIPILMLAVLYVSPAYAFYAHAEEGLLRQVFGGEYDRYRARVPMLFPWPGSSS